MNRTARRERWGRQRVGVLVMLWSWRRALKIWGSVTAFVCVLLYLFSPSVRSNEGHVGSSKQARDVYVPTKVYRVYVGVDQDRSNRSRIPPPPPHPPPVGRGVDTRAVIPPDVQSKIQYWAKERIGRPPRVPLPPAPPPVPAAEFNRGPVRLGRGMSPLMGAQVPNGETAWSREARLRREERKAVRARNHASFMQLQAGGTLSPYQKAMYSHPMPRAPPNIDTFQRYIPPESMGPYHKNSEGVPPRSQYNENRGADSPIKDSVAFLPKDLDDNNDDTQNSVQRTKFANEKVNVWNQPEIKRSTRSDTFSDLDRASVSQNEGRRLWMDLLDAIHKEEQSKNRLKSSKLQRLPADNQITADQAPPNIPVETLNRERGRKSTSMSDIDSVLSEENQSPDISNLNDLQSKRGVRALGSQTATSFANDKLQQNEVPIQSMSQPVDSRKSNSIPEKAFESPHNAKESTIAMQDQDQKTSAPPRQNYLNIRSPLIKKHSSKMKPPSVFRKIKKAGPPFFVDNSLPSEDAQDSNEVAIETKNTEIDKLDRNGESRDANTWLSLHSKTQHSNNQQAVPNTNAKTIDIQVTPKVDTAPNLSPNATKCAPISRALGHVMALSYFDQITTSVKRIASLQCWASQLGMAVVEPAFRSSSFGAPRTRTSVKFSDLFDVLDWNDLMSQNCYTSLKGWEDFLYRAATRSLILVQLVYPQGPPKGIFGEKMDCGFTRLEEYYTKVLKPVGFTIARKVCIDFSRQPYLSSYEFKKRILGAMDPSEVTVLFNQWRGICSGSHCPGSHLVSLTDSSCGYNSILPSLLDFLTPSEQLFRDAQSYVVQKMDAASEYGAVMLRWERVPYASQCIANILEQWRTLASNANMPAHRHVFLATDIGQFGSYELKKNGVPNYIFQETEKLLRNLFRKPLSFVDYEQSFLDVATTSNPGYVSLLQKTISAQARCLLLVGRGAFQEHTLHMFKQLQPENHCYKMVAGC